MGDPELDAWMAERLAIANFRPTQSGTDALRLIEHLTGLGWNCRTGSVASGCWAWVGNPITGAHETSGHPADLGLILARAARAVLDPS